MNRKIAVIGGDKRILCAVYGICEETRLECAVCGFDRVIKLPECVTRVSEPEDAVKDAFAVILPLPASKDGLRVFAPFAQKDIYTVSVLSLLSDHQFLLGGMLDCRINEIHEKTFDYYTDEEIKMQNAIPTAEGAISLFQKESEKTVYNSEFCVLGYGRIGKMLCKRIYDLGGSVKVCARRESDLALAKALGYKAFGFEHTENAIAGSDCVFNTVPAEVISEKLYPAFKNDSVYIELASKPGGIDFAAAKQYGINAISAPGIPGNMFAKTSGDFIKDKITEILTKEGKL